MKEFIIDMPFLDIPVSGWTCFNTLKMYDEYDSTRFLFFLVPAPPAAAFLAAGAAFLADCLDGVLAILFQCCCFGVRVEGAKERKGLDDGATIGFMSDVRNQIDDDGDLFVVASRRRSISTLSTGFFPATIALL